ncbi:peptide ABC transporter substrate-binding protein [Devosia epidermidihirudinis]|uniref:Peptide ABC transporter substrate-binding protein n=1 Tax=Devosia epidermidihirudinis TaxID=1293439 RepID=A0A0F5QJ72_9HYPH|nr:peptide ABC transporter substrate-binding protein [Devosia epidermidihirudinis]KKC41020.1 peptide ABC transporter substrate-binding protein [Devosia epidermidihirudinis]
MKTAQTFKAAAVAVALLGATALTMPTFAASVPEGTTLAAEQVFKYRVLDNINTLDPQLVEDVDTSAVVRSLFEGLYNSGADGNPVPGVAESYEVNADNTVYTFHLRDAKWSNGDPVTAGDFVYAWQRAVNPETASNYAYFVGLVGVVNADAIVAGEKPVEELGVKAIDDKTLEVNLAFSSPWFIRTLSHATLYPSPKAVIEAKGIEWTKPENIVGNGAYTLAENTPGERVIVKRNPNYWDDAHTVLNEVQFLTINDENQGLTRWRAGEVDQTDVPAGQYPALKAELPDETFSVPQFCTYYFDVNMTDKQSNEALKDVRVREALNLSIDRDVIVNGILQGGQQPAYSFAHPLTAGYIMPQIPAASMTQDERDARAEELIAEAGYGKDNPLTINYIYNTSDAHKKIATVVGQMWKEKLGVTLNLQDMEFQTLIDTRHEKNFELARDAWCGDYNEASTFLSLLDSNSDQNNSGYSNAQVDGWLAEAKTSEDPNVQYAEVETQTAKDVAIMPIYYYAKVFMQNESVKGWPYDDVEQNWYAKDLYKVAE